VIQGDCKVRSPALLLLLAGCGLAGDWQATAGAGFGAYHPVTFGAPAGTAQAGIGPRFVLNAAIGRQIGQHLAVEGTWTYQDGDFELSSGGTKTAFDASAQAAHSDVLGYLRRRSSRWRPFIVAGAGVKFYVGSETPAERPLSQFASFRQGTDSRALLLFGGGMEWNHSIRWALRLELCDYTTPFPTGVIVPAEGAKLGGWLHDFVAVIGITIR
jgi:hypothetical protein